MKQWRVLLILIVAHWIKLTGSNLCTLRATASLDNNRNDRLELVLQCGTTTCSPPKFRCDGIHDGLAIECTRKNCGVMKTYNLCEIPNNICVRYEQLQNRECPSSTFAENECMPVTTTAYKTINESVEHTPSIKSTAGIPEPSPSTHNHLLSTTEVVTITKFTTKTIASVTTIPCSRIVPINDVQQNESVVNQSQCSQALGALLGLVVVVLAVVITGWVWTCWIMKKKGGMKLTSNKHERSFQNPMYTGITQTRQSSNGDKHMTEVPTYATVSKPSKRQTDGNKHNQVNIKTSTSSNSQMHHYQQESEDVENNYSLLGKEDSGEYNITGRSAETNDDYVDPDEEEKGWGQESPENVYHVLEGPAMAMEEGEGPTQDEATVYEVPVPSKPLRNN